MLYSFLVLPFTCEDDALKNNELFGFVLFLSLSQGDKNKRYLNDES